MIDKKTIYWVVAGIGAYLLYRWWSNKQKTAEIPLPRDIDNRFIFSADILADNQEGNAGTKIEGDRSKVIGEIFCPLNQHYDKACQCCKQNSTSDTSRKGIRWQKRQRKKYLKSNPRFW